MGKSPILGGYSGLGKLIEMKTPQQLSREAIEDFKAIYQDEFGQELSDDEVQKIALRLLRLFGILQTPVQSDNPEDVDVPF